MSKEEFEAANKKASDKKKAVYEAPEWGGGMRQVISKTCLSRFQPYTLDA